MRTQVNTTQRKKKKTINQKKGLKLGLFGLLRSVLKSNLI
jgi:hypothetical protein